MARKLRLEYKGAIYHVLNRGARRQPIFRDDADRRLFLETLGQVCQKTDWQLQAWCLMSDHFHLVIETPQANLVAGMKWFLGAYTGRFNRRHKRSGHLFCGRYKSLIVDGSVPGYLSTACDYVHLNPVRAELLKSHQPLSRYAWSSYGEYLKSPSQRKPWLRVERLFREMGIRTDTAAGRLKFEQRVEARRKENDARQWKRLRRGWYLGGKGFRKELLELLEQMGQGTSGKQSGAGRTETVEAKAERIVREELKKLGWRKKDLERHAKGDRRKVRIARRLRQETTITSQWIADRLQMGTKTYLAHLLYWHQRGK